MKALILLTVLVISLLPNFFNGPGKSVSAADLEYASLNPDTTGSFYFINPGFEEWNGDYPEGWLNVNDTVGNTRGNVRTARETLLRTEGDFSVRLQSIEPFGGISHQVTGKVPEKWSVYPEKGKAAVHYAKENGTSAFFNMHSLVQDDFELPVTGELSTAIRNIRSLRIDNGDYIELFSASTTSETSPHGAVYMKRNGGDPVLFMQLEDHKTWASPGVVDMGSKYVFVSMRIGQDGQQHMYATDVSRDFTFLSNDRLLFDIDNYNIQCYRIIKLDDGTVVIPFVYARHDQIYTGPWYLDILTTTDFISLTRLNAPRTYQGRGLMEPYPVLLSDGTIAIMCRTNQGHIAKAIYNHISNTLSLAFATEIVQPGAGSFAANLSDNSILLSWLANIDMRKVIVMAVSDDDMATWQSFHVIITSEAMGHSMTWQPPYVHQPYIYEDTDGSLVCYFEEVLSASDINLYKTVASGYRIHNVANTTMAWQTLEVAKPEAATLVQLLNIIESEGSALFDQPAVTLLMSSISSGINVYPNPVKDIFYIASGRQVTKIELYTLNGKLLRTYGGANSVSMNDIEQGVYLAKVYRGDEAVVFKIFRTN